MEKGTYLVTFRGGQQLTGPVEDFVKLDREDLVLVNGESYRLSDIEYFSNEGGTWKVGVPAKEENVVQVDTDSVHNLLASALNSSPVHSPVKVIRTTSEVEELKAEVERLRGEVADKEGEVANLNLEISTVLADNKQLVEQHNEALNDIETLATKVSELEAKVVELSKPTKLEEVTTHEDKRVPRDSKKE